MILYHKYDDVHAIRVTGISIFLGVIYFHKRGFEADMGKEVMASETVN